MEEVEQGRSEELGWQNEKSKMQNVERRPNSESQDWFSFLAIWSFFRHSAFDLCHSPYCRSMSFSTSGMNLPRASTTEAGITAWICKPSPEIRAPMATGGVFGKIGN